MKKDQLIRANELDRKITNIEEEIKAWERASAFIDTRLELKNGKATVHVSLGFVGFDAIKGIALSQLKSQLSTAQKEFEKL